MVAFNTLFALVELDANELESLVEGLLTASAPANAFEAEVRERAMRKLERALIAVRPRVLGE